MTIHQSLHYGSHHHQLHQFHRFVFKLTRCSLAVFRSHLFVKPARTPVDKFPSKAEE